MKTLTASSMLLPHLGRALHVEVEQEVDPLALGPLELGDGRCRSRWPWTSAHSRSAPASRELLEGAPRSTKWYSHPVPLRPARGGAWCARPRSAARPARAAPGAGRSTCPPPRAPRPRSRWARGSLNVLHLLAEPLDLRLQAHDLAG